MELMPEDVREQLFGLKNQLQSGINLIEKSNICEHNKELILKFKDYLINRQISILRVKKYLILIRQIALKIDKDLDKFTKDDVDSVMSRIRTEGYMPASINDFISVLKLFYRHQQGLTDDEMPSICKHLKRARTISPITREMLLTESDVNRFIACVDGIQNKTIISMLYECALRPSELRGLRLCDVSKTAKYYKLTCDGKTGRKIAYVIVGAPILTEHLNSHPFANNKDSPLFYSKRKDKLGFLSHSALNQLVKKTSKKVLGREIHAYIFRHSRATALTLSGMQDPQLKKFMGHSATGRALATYQKLIDSDVETALLSLSGLPTEQKEMQKNEFIAKNCPKCGAVVASHEALCAKCGAIVSEIAIISEETEKEKMYEKMEAKLRGTMQEEFIKMLQRLKQMPDSKGAELLDALNENNAEKFKETMRT